jgi:hypothetical protein
LSQDRGRETTAGRAGADSAARVLCMVGLLLAASRGLGAQLRPQQQKQQEPQPPQHPQAEPSERLYNHSQVEVDQALQSLKAYDTFRLPILEGFVAANAGVLTSFENPHYQFKIGIFPQSAAQTLVQVTAKITAWYADQNPDHSQYVMIPSNGRLEEDLLDRLNVALERENPRTTAAIVGTSPALPGTADPGTAGASTSSVASAGAVPGTENLAAQIVAVQTQRKLVEEHVRKLEQQVSELQANSKSQRYLSNLAVVKMPQTPVFEFAEVTSKLLFRADPEDEFEVLSAREGWVQVRLENAGQAWIRISQLQPPNEMDDPDSFKAPTFSTPTEEVKAFDGDWPPLKGKMALFVFAQPAKAIQENMLGHSQLDFAKQTFTLGYREAVHSETPVEGIVVVFLGAKGGVAAATLADIKRWREGLTPDKQFLAHCSFDPPESFRDTAKH